ncbi:PAS domain S-box protein [Virgifigura deserti]|uniref:PAS domain S-box protein n=1 Tax=Virgifigura deserti TaxID=2268457 RepID=UPI003CCC1180
MWHLDAQEYAAQLLKVLPAAVYVCDAEGFIVGYNDRAAELWGRRPKLGDPALRFCGSHRLYWPDGRPLPHDQTPMRDALVSGTVTKDGEVVFERPDGSRFLALVNITPLRDAQGDIVGAVNCFQDITERKRTEDDLRRSRQDLEDFFENGTVALHWVGSDGTILRANQAELDLLGYTLDEYIGLPIAEVHADRATIDDILARLSRGERLDKYPARLRAKDGSIRHVLISSNVRFQNGQFVNTRCFTVDVTERRQAEAALRESEARLRMLIEALPAAIYTTDKAGRITDYNEGAVHLWGHRPELGSGKWCGSWRLYWPDGTPMPHDQCPMAIALKEDRPIYGAEAVAERPDGSHVPFAAYPMPLHDTAGKLVGAVNMLVDITERKRAEQSAQQLAAIVESSDDAIISKDLNGIIATWNAGAERLFGYTADEVIGKPITILIPPDRHDEEPEILNRIRRGERLDHYETVRRRKDGSLIEISLTVSPVRGTDGRVTGASKIARDITERKRAEERLQLLAREVDHRAKNMLAVIQSMVHLTRAGTIADFVSAINGRIGALAHAHSLLSQSHWEGADLTSLAEEELAPYCRPEDPRVRVDGPNLTLVPVAAQSIAMALHELATNAVKYGAFTSPGGHVSIQWSRRADGRLVLRWTETGGPPVQKPSRRGFGMDVIERMVRDQLEGAVQFAWRTEGLICEIELPANAIAHSARTAAE